MKNKNILFLSLMLWIFVAGLCSSCSHRGLYNWCDYEKTSYSYYKKQTPESMNQLMLTYQNMINNQERSRRKVLPPGIHGEFGYLLLRNGKKAEGIEQLHEEMDLYPESSKFINRILKMVEE